MSRKAIALPALPPLSDFDHVNFAEVSSDDPNVATFWVSHFGYVDRRQEAEYESNATVALARIRAADADYVKVEGSHAHVTIFARPGVYTAAYVELIAILKELSDYPILDGDDLHQRLEMAADDIAFHFEEEAAEILDGGEAAFQAHEMVAYLGSWSDYAEEPRDLAISSLSINLAAASIDND